MSEYRIEGDHYQGRSGTWYWRYDVYRITGHSDGREVRMHVDHGVSYYRIQAVLSAWIAVIGDRWHQRQKSRPISIRTGKRP